VKIKTETVFSLPALVGGLVPENVDIDVVYSEFNASVEQEIDALAEMRNAGESVIPEVMFSQLCSRGFTAEQAELIRRRGCVVVRGTFAESDANRWNQSLNDYLSENDYFADLHKAIQAGDEKRAHNPHMLDIYWSKSQLEIRQSSRLRELQKRLNGLWRATDTGYGAFNPDVSYTYADRIRSRQPTDQIHGLSPHVDNCSMESWFSTETIARTYGSLLNGEWQSFDAFNAANRACTDRKPHPDSCSVFRSYQGWVALTPQGSECGSLQLVPSSRCVAWLFLNLLQSSLHDDHQVYPLPFEAYMLHAERHAMLIKGLCSLPQLNAGDTVWWHPDAVHAVEHLNKSKIPSTVAYLGIAPDCARNRQYMRSQLASFKQGLSPPDFPQCDIEKNYRDRATEAQLSAHGKRQMGRSGLSDSTS